ncbi:MAG: choice-of-anchor D domain-containing protein, partial [Myxococcaceae bacterium]
MTSRLLVLGTLAVFGAVFPGCRNDNVRAVPPDLAVSPAQLAFGKVKAGGQAELPLKLASQSQAAVTLHKLSLRDGNAPGGATAFEILDPPNEVARQSEASVRLRFRPEAIQAYGAILVIESDDADQPTMEVAITGEGADPVLSVLPDCSQTRRCNGTVTLDPPAIDFGEEPVQRAVELPATELPSVTMVNEGEVELIVTALSLEGPDSAAFSFVGNSTLPHRLPDGTPALILGPGEGQGVPLRFKPTSEAQETYAAEVVIRSDDPAHAEVRVQLTGQLGDNLPPQVCANIVRVAHFQDVTQSYDTRQHWDDAQTALYDFTTAREIRPKSTVSFSALSNAADARACTTDPEDQRQGLMFQWSLTKVPVGAENLTLANANTPTPSLTPVATGEYEVQLTVTDAQGHSTSIPLRFVVARREDLVVQLSWNGDSRAFSGVDFDLHLVRPTAVQSAAPFSGAFDWFGGPGKTSGDMSGYGQEIYERYKAEGFNFDWGQTGTADDPRQNLDDTGSSDLIENISLNYPENDPACATADCTYKVFVHYFGDGRMHSSPQSCNVSGCLDGEACGCPAGLRCVADDALAQAASGAGKCYRPPEPVVRLFFKGSPI